MGRTGAAWLACCLGMVACGGPNAVPVAGDDVLDIVWQGTPRAEGGRRRSWIERRLEERYRLRLHTNFISVFSYTRRLTFMLVGGDVPDVFWGGSAREVQRNARHGFIMELPHALLREHAPRYVALVNRHAPRAWLLSHHQGKNWALPLLSQEAAHPTPGMWRLDWLRNVGLLGVPETLEDTEEALRRFRTRDPDGNGRQDSYGLITNRPPGPTETIDRTFEEILGAFGILSGWQLDGGRVVWGTTRPATRDALALLRRWYAEGLIWPDYSVAPLGNLELLNRLAAGHVGYAFGSGIALYEAFDETHEQSFLYTVRRITPGASLAPGTAPIGPRGERGIRAWPGASEVLMFGAHLAQQPEKVVRVLRMLDTFASDTEAYLEARLGQRGRHWDHTPARGLFAQPPFDERRYAAPELLYWRPEISSTWGYFAAFSPDPAIVDRYTRPEKVAYRDRHRPRAWGLQDVFGHSDVVPGADMLLPPLVQLQAKVFAEIVTGRRPLAAWGEFVTTWRARGGAKLEEAANQLYADRTAIVAAAGAEISP